MLFLYPILRGFTSSNCQESHGLSILSLQEVGYFHATIPLLLSRLLPRKQVSNIAKTGIFLSEGKWCFKLWLSRIPAYQLLSPWRAIKFHCCTLVLVFSLLTLYASTTQFQNDHQRSIEWKLIWASHKWIRYSGGNWPYTEKLNGNKAPKLAYLY